MEVEWAGIWPVSTFLASFPGSSGTRIIHAWRDWYLFSRDHDVIKIEPGVLEQKGNVLRIIQQNLRSTLSVASFPSSPRFSVLQAMENWPGPGNEAVCVWYLLSDS